MSIKESARTIREPVTEAVWDQHLSGTRPLGIIPITEEDECNWGCIDVDKYDIVLADVAERVASRKAPLVLCRSKSGGAHLFAFVSRPIPASLMRAWLRNLAAQLGYGDCEIFPKQSKVLREKGDAGNWVTMPYMGKTETGAIKRTGAAMELKEFLATAERTRVNPDTISVEPEGATVTGLKEGKKEEAPFQDGPPCIQHLAAIGVKEGISPRNITLFSMGIYAKKKWPSKWQEVLEEYNRRYMEPPLPSEEIQQMLGSLQKKDYNYKCGESPHCNTALCRTRKYGVGGTGTLPLISSLSVLNTDPPLWFMDIEDERIEMSTDDLQNYKRFHKVCMEQLHICYRSLGQDAWLRMIADVMSNVVSIEVPEEVAVSGQFKEILEDFLTNKQRGERIEDILSGRPWEDTSSGRHIFRLRDLQRELERAKMQPMLTRGRITQRIRDLGGGNDFMNIKGHGTNVWWIPSNKVQALPRVGAPVVKGEEI